MVDDSFVVDFVDVDDSVVVELFDDEDDDDPDVVELELELLDDGVDPDEDELLDDGRDDPDDDPVERERFGQCRTNIQFEVMNRLIDFALNSTDTFFFKNRKPILK